MHLNLDTGFYLFLIDFQWKRVDVCILLCVYANMREHFLVIFFISSWESLVRRLEKSLLIWVSQRERMQHRYQLFNITQFCWYAWGKQKTNCIWILHWNEFCSSDDYNCISRHGKRRISKWRDVTILFQFVFVVWKEKR